MGGISPVAPYAKTDYTSQTATAYKTNIDANSVVGMRFADNFAPRAQASPNMTIALDAGHLFDGTTLTEVAAQNTGTLTAPSVHPRIDRVVIDNITGTLSVITGAEAVSPTPPAITSGKSPVAQIALATSTTSITNALITDERDFTALNIGGTGTQTNLSSASTCDLGTISSHNIKITGTTTITAFGSSANTIAPIYKIEFAGALTLTHNATSLILPGAANIKTAAGDTADCEFLGSGNWRVRSYQRANGQTASMTGTETTLASATTTDLGSTGVNAVLVSGTTTITGFGSSASLANPVYFVRFSGILTLTHNGTSLIIPGAANITTAAGDSLVALNLGSGNWRVLAYNRATPPGDANTIVQIVKTETGAVSTGSTALPFDDTIPQNTEGDQFLSVSITPASATNILQIDVFMALSNSATSIMAFALFQDSTANALAATGVLGTNAGIGCGSLRYFMTAGTTSATTFNVRAGAASGTTTFNGAAGARKFGGVCASSISITEIKV